MYDPSKDKAFKKRAYCYLVIALGCVGLCAGFITAFVPTPTLKAATLFQHYVERPAMPDDPAALKAAQYAVVYAVINDPYTEKHWYALLKLTKNPEHKHAINDVLKGFKAGMEEADVLE